MPRISLDAGASGDEISPESAQHPAVSRIGKRVSVSVVSVVARWLLSAAVFRRPIGGDGWSLCKSCLCWIGWVRLDFLCCSRRVGVQKANVEDAYGVAGARV